MAHASVSDILQWKGKYALKPSSLIAPLSRPLLDEGRHGQRKNNKLKESTITSFFPEKVWLTRHYQEEGIGVKGITNDRGSFPKESPEGAAQGVEGDS